jgi:superfamily II DNA or RNA helicase
MDISKLRRTYDINIYEIYKNLKKSGKTEFDNNDLCKIFEYFSCIKLTDEYKRVYYQYDDIDLDYKEEHNLSRRDTGIDACDLDKTIVQCKLRKSVLNWKECSTFFASQNIHDEQSGGTIIKWPNLIITRNAECTLSENLLFNKKRFIDKPYSRNDIISYCDGLIKKPPKYFEADKSEFKLRDYQQESIDVIKNNENSIICLPTGTGKNVVIIYSMEDNKKYLILVPRIILMEQLNNEIIKHKPHLKNKIGLLGDGNNIVDSEKDIIICVYNSVGLIEGCAPIFDKIFIDEAHHIYVPEIYTLDNDDIQIASDIEQSDEQSEEDDEDDDETNESEEIEPDDSEDEIKNSTNYIKIIKDFQQFNNNVYLSATIDQLDGFTFYKKDIRDMIEAGHICDYMINVPIFTDDPSNVSICKYLIKNYRNIIIYCNSTKEGKNINKILNGLQNKCSEYIDCYTSKTIRNRNIKKFKEGELQFLVNVRILVEGFDAPITKGVCFLHLPSSSTTIIQIIGRCLRPHKESNKRYANIILPYSTNEDAKSINKFLKEVARNDRKIREAYENKKLGGRMNMDSTQNEEDEMTEDLEDELELKFEMIYDRMGKLLNGDDIWMKQLEMVKKYIDEHKKRPSDKDKNKEIKTLGIWLLRQIYNSKYRKQIMKNEDIYQKWILFINDSKYKGYFLDDKTKWRNRLEEVKKYIEKYKKIPSTIDKNQDIKILINWISTQKANIKERKRILREDDIYNEWISFINDDKYKEYFLDNKTEWRNKLEEVKKYIEKYKKRPIQKDENIEIKKLGCWISNQQTRAQARKEIMKEDDIYNEWLAFINDDKYKEYFLDNKIDWRNKLEEVKKYIHKYKNRPSKCDKNLEIKQLGSWLSNQINNSKDRERIMKEDDIYNEWNSFINDNKYKEYFLDNKTIWMNNLKKMKIYIDKYKKRPSKRDKNIEIKQLGAWTLAQINKSKKRKNIMKEDDIFIKWLFFINHPKYCKYFEKDYILSLGSKEKNMIETLEEITKSINYLRDELNKLPELVFAKTITDMEDYEERFNDINDELTRLENIRENIYNENISELEKNDSN